MTNVVNARLLCLLTVGTLLTFLAGCGWSSRQSRNNTQTGISESGYPGHGAADPGSPALESMRREEKKGVTERETKTEAGRPGAEKEETNTPGRVKTDKK